MSEGVIGIVGTLVGGMLGVVGTLASARLTGRDQRRNQHEQWRRQVRRDAYSAFVIRAGHALRLANVAHEAARTDDSNAAELLDELSRAVDQVEEAATLVELEGPEAIGNAAVNIQFRIDAWYRALDRACNGSREQQTEAWSRAADASQEAEDQAEQFISLCRRLLDEQGS
ncbi:hypothetical protein [Streptomyces lydicus]|nr:hypothetical protein [Streptomyces lydicus]